MLATSSINGNSSKAISASTRTLNQPLEHQQQPPVPLPRLIAANDNNITNTSAANMNTRTAQRTRSLRSHKPLTITTQKPTTGSEGISQMQQGGSAQEIYTSVKTPRSASVRRKPVAAVPCSPVGTAPSTPLPPGKPPLQTARINSDVSPPVAMSVKERVVRANNNKNITNGDRDQDMSHSAGVAPFLSGNSSNNHTSNNTITLQRGNSMRQSSNGSSSSGHGSGESINSSRSLGSASSNGGGLLSSKRKISNGSPQNKSGGGGIGGGGGNVGQKFGEFLAISGSLLGSKKPGSDTSIKSASSNTEAASSLSSTSISSLTKESITSGIKMAKMTGTMLFSKKDSSASLISPKAPKSSLLASIFSPDSRPQPHLPHSPSRSMPMQHTSNNHTKEGSNNLPLSPMDHDMGVDDYGYPTGTQQQQHGRHQHNGSSWDMVDDDKIVNWELNKTIPTSYYEDEAFGLWIRPNHEARTTISGADVEKAEKEGRDNITTSYPNAGAKKKNRPELEDMEVLEEVLDFSIIILMRASASLYPFISSAHSKSIPFNILWRSLQFKERSFRHQNIRALKEYQDYVMADIGCAIQAMNEIYDQLERPFGHPDNFARDTKPRPGVRSPPVIMPPNRVIQLTANNIKNGILSKGPAHHASAMHNINTSNGGHLLNGSNLHIQSPQKHISNQQQALLTPSSVASPFKKHRHHTSVPGGRPTIASMITSIKQSIPSPISLHSAQSARGNSTEGGYSHPYYSSYPDGTPFLSGFPAGVPTSYSQATSPDSHYQSSITHTFTSSFLSSTSSGGCSSAGSNHSGGSHYSFAGLGGVGGNGGGGGGFLPQSIQTVINSFRHSAIGGGGGGSIVGGHPLVSSSSSQFMAHPSNLAISPVPLTKQEEKRLHLENQWRVDIMRRKAHLRGWACRSFMTLYEFSLQSAASSLHEEFKDLYRIIRAIVEVDATATEKSHEILAMVLAQAQECEKEPFQLRYNQYSTPAPTGKEIRDANEEAIRKFEAVFKEEESKEPVVAAATAQQMTRGVADSAGSHQGQGSFRLSLNGVDHDDRVAPLRPVVTVASGRVRDGSSLSGASSISSTSSPSSSGCTPSLTSCSSNSSSPTTLSATCYSSAYENMDLFGLQRHPVWDPLMDRLTKFDTTHHELDARNIFHFFRRMSLDYPSVSEPPCRDVLADESRDELLAVLWVLEKCVRERPDAHQSPTWFRLSSSVNAVQAVFRAGGVIPYLKELQEKDIRHRDPIQTVHPVTLTGYFKRLLKDCGGLLLKETTALFVELARPATDNGDFWNLEKLSRIDRALLYRVICLDYNRGRVFLRISRVMEQILESSPKDMELDAFALSKMVQVVELSGVLDLKALRRYLIIWEMNAHLT
ncbi:hypothetical protein KI688_001770 [Linnemannia hyalina]|uniref:Uncharacterized protein n=1 Tax=Linnemannia hyalina TaxID=64524 RepID=A0A9P8BR13_9FUNG|nr:hypothetical protein KI688_001770 [Linnemannia hyalina]